MSPQGVVQFPKGGAEMRISASRQYGGCGALMMETSDFPFTERDIEELIELAHREEAIYWEGDDACIVVSLPGRPIEIYMQRAFRASLRAQPAPSATVRKEGARHEDT